MKACVIGSGSWGTALSQVLADADCSVSLAARRQSVADGINERHRNPDYLSDALLSEKIVATTSLDEAFAGADACVIVTPSGYLRHTARVIGPHVRPQMPLVICSKGAEDGTGALPADIFSEEVGGLERICVLSGPTHAEEVVRRVPSSVVCASVSEDTARTVRDLFFTDAFRTYTSDDLVGVELCGAFKNVIAIAVGISYGLGMGDNTAATLITRGLAEMSRMVDACGGNVITCMGLAGAGDLVVTCTSRHSRNRRFGEDYVARGRTLQQFEADTHMVVEGALACKTLSDLAARHHVELPLTEAVRQVVWDGADARALAKALLDRPLKSEF